MKHKEGERSMSVDYAIRKLEWLSRDLHHCCDEMTEVIEKYSRKKALSKVIIMIC